MKSLALELLTPEHHSHWQVRYLSLDDTLGRFGIQPGHQPFLTPLQRSVGYFEDIEGVRHFLAHDSGILRVEIGGRVFLMARVILIGPSLQVLEQELDERIRQVELGSEMMRENIHNLQKTLLKQILSLDTHLLKGIV